MARKLTDLQQGARYSLDSLAVICPVTKKQTYQTQAILGIGRAETNYLKIQRFFPAVSRFHAQIVLTEEGAYILDSHSSNGTVILRDLEYQKVPSASSEELDPNNLPASTKLRPGDKIILCPTNTRYELMYTE